MPLLGDLVLQTANNPGTGTFNLIAAPVGRVSWVTGCGVGAGRFYFAHDGTDWEVGDGTVSSGSPDTLSRDHVLRNSAGTTTRINFTSTVNVYNEVPAGRGFWADSATTYDAQARTIRNMGFGTTGTDAIRYDQAGGISLGYHLSFGGFFLIPFPSAASSDMYQIDFFPFRLFTMSPIYFRISVDNMGSFLAGSGEYGQGLQYSTLSSGFTSTQLSATYAQMTQPLENFFGIHGRMEIFPAALQWRSRFYGYSTSAGYTQDFASGNWTNASVPTHILISGVVSGISDNALARVVKIGA